MNYLHVSKNKIEEIISVTQHYYSQCEKVSGINNNLIGLYFHEIVRFYSTSFLSLEISKYRNGDNKFLEDKVRFGYRDGVSIYSSNLDVGYKRRLVLLLSRLPIFNKRPILHLGDVSVDNLKIIMRAYLKGYKVKYISNGNKVYIDKFSLQNEILRKLIDDLCVRCNVELNGQLVKDVGDALNIVSEYSELCEFKNKDVLLIGSPAKVANRKASSNAFYCGINVIGVLHSDESGSVNLPSWIYDDRSNCTHLVGYGPAGSYLSLSNENSLLSLSERNYTYIQSDSEACRKIYDKNKCISELFNYQNIHEQRGLYVSSRIRDVSAINPYPLIDPLDYIKWQEYLLAKFPEVSIKTHPKQNYKVSYYNKVIKEENLMEVVDSCIYDFFIIDNVASTAFPLIAATNVPVIYFNIEMPYLTEEAEQIIRKRVLWVDIDIFADYDGFESYMSMKVLNKFVNYYTPQFSLSDKPISRVSVIDDLL